MLQLKGGVSLYGLKPEMVIGVIVVMSVFAHFGYDTTFTSGTDGKHGTGSYHPLGYAGDFRTFHVPDTKLQAIVELVKRSLGDEFDVVLESDHLHVEYDLNKVRTRHE